MAGTLVARSKRASVTILHISIQIFQTTTDVSANLGLFEICMFGYAENVPMDIPRFQFPNFIFGENQP